jgi:hypothetical protein
MTEQQQQQAPPTPPELKWLDGLANAMDNQFRIPGTNFRFGFDALMGLVPGAGDIAGLSVAVVLSWVMLRKGAGPLLMLRMIWNIALDATVGTIPLLGDLFDMRYKANRRNVDLLKSYYSEGKARPNTLWSAAFILLLALALLAGLLYLAILLGGKIWGWLGF